MMVLYKIFDNLSILYPENKYYSVLESILEGITFILTDSDFLLMWYGIFKSTQVLLLLNKQINNSEQLDSEIDKRHL